METAEPSVISTGMQHRFRVEDYHRMIEAGIFQEDEHLELLSGLIVKMTPQGVPHAVLIERLSRVLFRSLAEEYRVRVQLPLTLGEDSEPEPDLAVVSGQASISDEGHPTSALLVVEVAGDSLGYDRDIKAALYARSGIAEYWIVNVAGECVEVMREPDAQAGRYRSTATVGRGERVACKVLPAVLVAVDDLLA